MKHLSFFTFFILAPFFVFASGMTNIKAVMFDMEGVLKTQSTPHSGASSIIEWMKGEDIPGLILTNEDQYTTEEIRQDLLNMGIEVPNDWEVYSAAEAMKDFIDQKLHLNQKTLVLVIGEEGLKKTLKRCENQHVHIVDELSEEEREKIPLYIALGTVKDLKDSELKEASRWVELGANVLLSCPDKRAPQSKSSFPRQVLKALSEDESLRVYSTGKPNPLVVSAAIQKIKKNNPGLMPHEILFVGDSIDTDMRAALEFGMQGALVLSGNTAESHLEHSIIQPDYVFKDVSVVLSALQDSRFTEASYEVASY